MSDLTPKEGYEAACSRIREIDKQIKYLEGQRNAYAEIREWFFEWLKEQEKSEVEHE